MAFASRLRSRAIRVAALVKLVPNLPSIRRGGRANPAQLLEHNADRLPDSPAILHLERRVTWAEFDAAANRWARFFLSRGVAHGDVVALVMDNRPEYLFALMGASKIRAITACVNTHVTGAALVHAIRAVRPRLVVAGVEHEAAVSAAIGESAPQGGAPHFAVVGEGDGARGVAAGHRADAEIEGASTRRLEDLRPYTEEAGSLLYTSGTTGLPKAAIVTNQRFLTAALGFGKVLHRAGPSDVIYVALPLYHGTAQWGGFGASLTTGAALAVRGRFSASAFWADCVRFGATRMMYIGELCRYLLHAPESPDERAHRVEVAVGNGLRPDVWPEFQRRFGVTTVREFYGATEGNAPLANLEGRPGMLGQLGYGQKVLRCDPTTGEVLRGPRGFAEELEAAGTVGLLVARIGRLATFDGYVDRSASERKVLRDVLKKGDAYFDTGDLVTVHEDGWVSFADRVGDTFRWKGENVSTSEVALLLADAPGVLESNVYGVVVPGADGRAGMASLRVAEDFDLRAFERDVEARLPKYAQPLFLRLLTDMSVTATFKQKKGGYRDEGYDPSRVADPMYARIDGRYVPLDAALHGRIAAGAERVG